MDKYGDTGEEQRERERERENPLPSISFLQLRMGDVTSVSNSHTPVFLHTFLPGSGSTPMDVPGLHPGNATDALIRFMMRRD